MTYDDWKLATPPEYELDGGLDDGGLDDEGIRCGACGHEVARVHLLEHVDGCAGCAPTERAPATDDADNADIDF